MRKLILAMLVLVGIVITPMLGTSKRELEVKEPGIANVQLGYEDTRHPPINVIDKL